MCHKKCLCHLSSLNRSCCSHHWFAYWFRHILGLFIDAFNGFLALLFSPLMPVLFSSCGHHYSCHWCSCWCCHLVTRVHDSYANSVTSLTDLVVNAGGSSLASLLSPLMPVLILSSCHHYSCRWCSCWCCRLVHDSHAGSMTSLLLSLMLVVAL